MAFEQHKEMVAPHPHHLGLVCHQMEAVVYNMMGHMVAYHNILWHTQGSDSNLPIENCLNWHNLHYPTSPHSMPRQHNLVQFSESLRMVVSSMLPCPEIPPCILCPLAGICLQWVASTAALL